MPDKLQGPEDDRDEAEEQEQHREGPRVARPPEPPFPAQHQESPGLESEMVPHPWFQAPAYRAAGKLEGQVALITGGDSGIGRAVALLFAREGADVALVYLPEEETDAREVVEAVEGVGRRALRLPGNVADADFCRQAVERTVAELGRLDVLVNNAAYQKHRESIEEITDEQLDWTFKVNIYGYFHMAKAAVPHLPRGGAIINTGSITGLEGSARLIDYAATKGAIHAFTKSLAQSLVKKAIRVNCVSPGPVWTPLNVADREAHEVAHFGEKTPMGRPAQPEEIAPIYVYFASAADSSFVTGEVFTLLGGSTTAA